MSDRRKDSCRRLWSLSSARLARSPALEKLHRPELDSRGISHSPPTGVVAKRDSLWSCSPRAASHPAKRVRERAHKSQNAKPGASRRVNPFLPRPPQQSLLQAGPTLPRLCSLQSVFLIPQVLEAKRKPGGLRVLHHNHPAEEERAGKLRLACR